MSTGGMTSRNELAHAYRTHRAGDLTEAARLYEAILSKNPADVDAIQLLGVLRQQQGHFAESVELCSKAVALCPNEPSYHANLAEAYRALGQLDQAVTHGLAALSLRRDYPLAHNNVALSYQAMGQSAQAVHHFQAALAIQPNYAQGHHNLGHLLARARTRPRSPPSLPASRRARAGASGGTQQARRSFPRTRAFRRGDGLLCRGTTTGPETGFRPRQLRHRPAPSGPARRIRVLVPSSDRARAEKPCVLGIPCRCAEAISIGIPRPSLVIRR